MGVKYMENKKTSIGFTLIEAVIALAIWMILSMSVILIWQYSAQRTQALLERQSAFENARGSMDVLVMNMQMAHSITLSVERWQGNYYILRELTLVEIDPHGSEHSYVFDFDVRRPPTATRFRHLVFGNTEFASNIAMIQIQPSNSRRSMNITVKTGCEYPIILEGSVDIRYKHLTISRTWEPEVERSFTRSR